MTTRVCEFCKESYNGKARGQRFCSVICREKHEIAKANARWLKDKPERKKPLAINIKRSLSGRKKFEEEMNL